MRFADKPLRKAMEKYVQSLTGVPLFRGIPPDELSELLNCLQAKESAYPKQAVILLEGQPVTRLGIVLSGTVQIVQEDFLGNRNIVAEFTKGSLFAESYACVPTDSLPVTVLSVTESEVLWLDYRRVVSTCSSACRFHTRLIENMLTILARKNILLNRKIEHLSKRTTREKILSYLAEQSARQGKAEFDIPFNRQELADYLCVDRSAMSNELSRLQKEGILRFQRNHFALARPQAQGTGNPPG